MKSKIITTLVFVVATLFPVAANAASVSRPDPEHVAACGDTARTRPVDHAVAKRKPVKVASRESFRDIDDLMTRLRLN